MMTLALKIYINNKLSCLAKGINNVCRMGDQNLPGLLLY